MKSSLAFLVMFVALSSAQSESTTVSLFLPYIIQSEAVASVIAVDATATTYTRRCLNFQDWEDENVKCLITGTETVLHGPSTVSYRFTTQEGHCVLTPEVGEYSCTLGVTATEDGVSTEYTTIYATSGYKTKLSPVAITAGVDRLANASPGSSHTNAALSTTTTKASAEAESDQSASTTVGEPHAPQSTGSITEAAPTSTNNAAGPRATQNGIIAEIAGGLMAMALM